MVGNLSGWEVDDLLFDELRGMVIDLPTGTILPGWVEKSAVIRAIDRVEAEYRARVEQIFIDGSVEGSPIDHDGNPRYGDVP